ncbi:hypothetical protein XELAEV_180331142mg, partial [Xenopus laevis]
MCVRTPKRCEKKPPPRLRETVEGGRRRGGQEEELGSCVAPTLCSAPRLGQ